MKSPVVAVIMLVVGLVVGIFIGPSVRFLQQKQQLSSLEKTTNIPFDRCRDLDDKQAKSCADSLLLEDALRKQDRTICSSISDQSVQKDCAARVDRLIKLGDMAAWCRGVASDSACVDLATMLLASESRDISKCNSIQTPVLLAACGNLISGSPSSEPTAAKPVMSKYQFGYNCDETNQYCVKDKQIFLTAVNNQNAKLCNDFIFNKDLCLQEVATYTAYKSGTTTACTAAPNQTMCRYDVVIAKALDAGNTSPCTSLDSRQVQGCKDMVSTTKEKRFDYLKETL